MSTKNWLVAIALLVALALPCTVGCRDRQNIDVERVEQSFQNAPDTERSEIEKALAAIRSGDITTALASLDKVTQSVRLTPTQQETLRDLITHLQQQTTKPVQDANTASNVGAKAGEAAVEAGGNIQKSLPKQVSPPRVP